MRPVHPAIFTPPSATVLSGSFAWAPSAPAVKQRPATAAVRTFMQPSGIIKEEIPINPRFDAAGMCLPDAKNSISARQTPLSALLLLDVKVRELTLQVCNLWRVVDHDVWLVGMLRRVLLMVFFGNIEATESGNLRRSEEHTSELQSRL